MALIPMKDVRINYSITEQKGLIKDKDDSLYQQVYNLYQKGLDAFLLQNTSLREYEEKTQTCYGHFIPANIVPSSHLVIALQYGKNNKKYDRDDFYRNQQAKDQFLKELVEEMKKELESILNIEVTVLVRTFVGE